VQAKETYAKETYYQGRPELASAAAPTG